ncbi:hypothetical protein DL93DRAFT_2223342 [Clavulina sp. PMI_390]|nr:hypothetical protein DL93DRAFT_2223342 [Clavulina sp. PMI_390]
MSQTGPTHHKFGEGYSGRNPVPTVQSFRAQHAEDKLQTAAHPPPTDPSTPPRDGDADSDVGSDSNTAVTSPTSPEMSKAPLPLAVDKDLPPKPAPTPAAVQDDASKQLDSGKKQGESKEEVMAKANANKEKPTDRLKKNKAERIARDPVTGLDVVIKDAEFSSYDNAALDPENPKPGPALQPPTGGTRSAKHQTPKPVQPTNVSFQPYPPEISTESMKGFLGHMDKMGYALAAGLAAIWVFTVFGRGFWTFLFRTSLIGTVAFGAFSMISITRRNMEKELERIRMDLHRVRGEKFSPPTPESVEWLNALLKTVWGLINPDMFISVADMVEDIMQASLPSFIDAVKISDLGQGSNPVRIVAMRGLPDQPGDKSYPREEWIDQGKPVSLTPEEEAKKREEGREDASLEDQSGDYVNMEVALSYQAKPGEHGDSLRTHNIHLMLEFFLGLYDWLHIPIPIYAVVEGFAVTARLRLQLVAEAPFIRNLTVTLMGVPKVEVSVVPMSKHLPNILDLPLISGFVQSAIAAAANEYVAPKSMTLNLAQILMGDGIKKDTVAVGILMIKIRHAKGLGAQDRSGSSDPYVVMAYTKLGKPLYSSRIILQDLNPVFEETAFLLVTADEINAQEDLSLQLWDSDKQSADDLVGRVIVSLKELMKDRNVMHDREDTLSGFQDADSMPGTISWSVGYYDKAPLNRAIQNKPEDAIPDAEDLPDDKKEELKPTPTVADTTDEADALTTPPDPAQPSGVLSVIVHYISNLERQDLKGASGDREGSAGQDTDDPTEQSGNLPSSYCEILLNDDMIYKTRTKQYTTMPFFEAGTERFIRDWSKTVVRVVVRDAKLREHDPILGIVNLPVAETLQKGSAVTGMYSLVEGVGFGRANVSILFRSFKVDLPKELRGWDTGTLHVVSDVKIELDDQNTGKLEGDQLTIGNTESTSKVPGKLCSRDESTPGTLSWTVDPSVRLPIYSRYQSAVHFNIGGSGFLSGGPEAFASLWLQDLVDDEEKDIRIPLVVSKKAKQLRQNYINEVTEQTHSYTRIGWLTCRVVLDSGLDADHEKVANQNQALRHNFEAWEHIEGQAKQAEINSHAMDDGVIDKDEAKALKRAHTRELASRHRGAMQFQAVRTAIWMRDGLKSRAGSMKNKATGKQSRKPTIETEA